MKATYGLLRKLPCVLLGFFPKQRRYGLGITSKRLFVVKSEYLICYDKEVSQRLLSKSVSQLSEYADLADHEEIKRVVSLRNCTIVRNVHGRKGFSSSIRLTVPHEHPLTIFFTSLEESEMWCSLIQSSSISLHLSDFEILGELGHGSFGTVQLVRYSGDGRLYAMKRIILSGEGESLLRQFVEERTVMQRVSSCIFIVQLIMAFREGCELFYILEYCERGDLHSWVSGHGVLKDPSPDTHTPSLQDVSASLILAVGALHSHHILHRDIKPENLLLTEHAAKLADFGLSKTLSSSRSRAFSFCGTDLYRPPEMSATSIGYNRSLDWWEVGCVLYECAVGKPAFDGDKMQRRQRVLKEEPTYPDYLSPSFVSLLQGLLKKDPLERLGAGDGDVEEVKASEYFRGYDWIQLETRALQGDAQQVTVGCPAPVRPPENRKEAANRIEEQELFGFEYDVRVMRDVCSTLREYAEMGGEINALGLLFQ